MHLQPHERCYRLLEATSSYIHLAVSPLPPPLRLEDNRFFHTWPLHRLVGAALVVLVMGMPIFRGIRQPHPTRLLTAAVLNGTVLLLFFPESMPTVRPQWIQPM